MERQFGVKGVFSEIYNLQGYQVLSASLSPTADKTSFKGLGGGTANVTWHNPGTKVSFKCLKLKPVPPAVAPPPIAIGDDFTYNGKDYLVESYTEGADLEKVTECTVEVFMDASLALAITANP